MNGAPLPHFNGFPARVVVPGWTGTYWMKHVITINALTKPLANFWMNPAYRIPVGKFPIRRPLRQPGKRHQHADHRNGGEFPDHQPSQRRQGESRQSRCQRHGLGRGLWHPSVEVSTDGGKTWCCCDARPGSRPLRVPAVELRSVGEAGKNTVMVNATNKLGQTQVSRTDFQRAGYHNNVMQNITLKRAREDDHADILLHSLPH